MCGVPHHAADTYVGRLIRRGFKVAICDQVEDAAQAKGIVKREIVRIVTPSTYLHQGYLEAKEPSYLESSLSDRWSTLNPAGVKNPILGQKRKPNPVTS
jgi:DNA mismatch repair protein MutS